MRIREPVVRKIIEVNKKIVEEVATTIGPKAFPSNPNSAGLNPWIKLPGLSLNAIDSNPP
jgi:hypothetical protein